MTGKLKKVDRSEREQIVSVRSELAIIDQETFGTRQKPDGSK